MTVKETKIYCFGNPYLEEDNAALELSKIIKIENVQFYPCSSPEDLFDEKAKELIIMDTAKGIEKVKVFSDISKLQEPHLLSLHDFDLAYFLKLMEKMGTLPEVTIIALPYGKKASEMHEEVIKTIQKVITS